MKVAGVYSLDSSHFKIAKEYCNLAEVRIRKTHDAFCSIKNGESPQK